MCSTNQPCSTAHGHLYCRYKHEVKNFTIIIDCQTNPRYIAKRYFLLNVGTHPGVSDCRLSHFCFTPKKQDSARPAFNGIRHAESSSLIFFRLLFLQFQIQRNAFLAFIIGAVESCHHIGIFTFHISRHYIFRLIGYALNGCGIFQIAFFTFGKTIDHV